MAKIWLDILTPKQFWYLRRVGEFLKSRGHTVIFTFRRYEQLTPFIQEVYEEEYYVVGEFGGADLREKLVKSVERTAELLKTISEFDCAVSGGSPEAARIAYGLAVPHVLASDTPESPVNNLVAPLSKKVATPWILGKSEWTKYGVKGRDIITYEALDPAAWLKDYKPDSRFLKKLELEDYNYVLIRSPEYKASYLKGVGWNLENYVELVKRVAKKVNLRTVVLPRYVDETSYLKKVLEGIALVVDKPVTNHDLLYHSKLFIGGGGTMTQEAALLGIPTLCFYPGKLPKVIMYLVGKKLVKPVKSINQLLMNVEKIVETSAADMQIYREKTARLLKSMENPAEKVAAAVEFAMAG